jgi:hypothetical protein
MAARKLLLILLSSVMSFPVSGKVAARPSSGTLPVAIPHATTEELASLERSGATNIYSTPPTFTLVPSNATAHPGKIWLRSTDQGVLIWGEVQAGDAGFRWPEQKSEMLASDHVEVWLTTTPDVATPAIGWGNQFGEIELAKPEDCSRDDEPQSRSGSSDSTIEMCKRWYGEQQQYRQLLRRLFVRQWLAAGEGGISGGFFQKRNSFEDFAATAQAGLSAIFFPVNLPTTLQPKMDDGFIALFDDQVRRTTQQTGSGQPYQTNLRTGYKFHLIIPYSAFPPARQLRLTDLYLAVDVFQRCAGGPQNGSDVQYRAFTPVG